jgi:hypothetical protein
MPVDGTDGPTARPMSGTKVLWIIGANGWNGGAYAKGWRSAVFSRERFYLNYHSLCGKYSGNKSKNLTLYI